MNKTVKTINQRKTKTSDSVDSNTQLNAISLAYLNSTNSRYVNYEMEAKFGTKGVKKITKIDYDNVIKKLKSLGYETTNDDGLYSLRIQPEFLDMKTGQFRTTNDFERFRVEINGLENIIEYCNTNDINLINKNNPNAVTIMKKFDVNVDEKDMSSEKIRSADFSEFNFRVTLKKEEIVNKNGTVGRQLFEKWSSTKKVFRFINRVSLHSSSPEHGEAPFVVDMSIVKSSSFDDRGFMIKTHTVEESNVFNNPESYEIEIEVRNPAKNLYTQPQILSKATQNIVKHVLCGLQKTNFPISYNEQKLVSQKYHRLLFEEEHHKQNEEYVQKDRIYPSDFIGPSLVTLGVENIAPLNPDVIIPNITEPNAYCVTEKADGERHLLYIDNAGRIYLINTNMNVAFTGAKTANERCFNSLIDGELILHDKNDNFINLFTAFDMYYVNKVDIRSRPFVKTYSKDKRIFENGCRLPILKDFVRNLNPTSIMATGNVSNSPIKIQVKNFYPLFDSESSSATIYNIFEASNDLLRNIADGNFDYEVDGLIFTPTLLGVGSGTMLTAGPKKKLTWQYCFKWKPSEATSTFPKSYNTIDFLVVTKKDANGNDVITPIFENGFNNYKTTQFQQYKTLILTVGFDPNKHGYINPCQDVLEDKYTSTKDNADSDEGYKPKQFFPTNPFDPSAGICNVMLKTDSSGKNQMFTEENEAFEDQTVVEFRYDISKDGLWKWIPMRVRYDKTLDFKNGNGVGANDYNTANNNWRSIHNPVTELMISSGQGIPGIEASDDIYYNSVTNDKLTKGLRDFHNLYVKKTLIQGVANKGNILIDFACGKAGDLPKWIASELSFVFGIDISKDNIENRLNGACARYLNFRKTTKTMPYALFVNGNSALNIRSGRNMFDDKANEITKAIFGSSNKQLGPAVARQQGKAHNGFDVSSCQFAMHYMFENKNTFYNFIRNVAECTKLNGHFIATCYDGQTIFNLLRRKYEGESDEIFVYDKKIWSITKRYDAVTFNDDESSLGYKIDVYQDSINKTLSEYLVNFNFLIDTMEKYGFKVIKKDDARRMGLPSGSGMFSELYNQMMLEVKRHPEKANDYKDAVKMYDNETYISGLNRYIVFKKITTINAESLTKTLLEQLPYEDRIEEVGTTLAREAVQEAENVVKEKKKKEKKVKSKLPSNFIIEDDEEA